MITEVLLILPLYLAWFFIWWQFRHVIKIMADVENILNDDEVFGDIVDTPKEGIYQHRKRGCLKSAIGSGKAYLLGRKWRRKKVNKASDETINKTYDAYKQRELNEKDEKTGNTIGKHVISLYSTRISRWLKSSMLKNYSRILKMILSLKIRWLT